MFGQIYGCECLRDGAGICGTSRRATALSVWILVVRAATSQAALLNDTTGFDKSN